MGSPTLPLDQYRNIRPFVLATIRQARSEGRGRAERYNEPPYTRALHEARHAARVLRGLAGLGRLP